MVVYVHRLLHARRLVSYDDNKGAVRSKHFIMDHSNTEECTNDDLHHSTHLVSQQPDGMLLLMANTLTA